MKALIAAILLSVTVYSANAQFRFGAGPATNNDDKPSSTLEAMSDHGDDFFSRLFDPTRFMSHQSYSFSFIGGSAGSVGLGMFTNTFAYKAADNLMISADVSAVYSPFSSFGSAFQKSINGIYLSNASLDWKLGDNTFVTVRYVGNPYANFYGSDPYLSSPFFWRH